MVRAIGISEFISFKFQLVFLLQCTLNVYFTIYTENPHLKKKKKNTKWNNIFSIVPYYIIIHFGDDSLDRNKLSRIFRIYLWPFSLDALEGAHTSLLVDQAYSSMLCR